MPRRLSKPFGLFVQDQWKIRRWTVNVGLQYDQFRTSYDAIHLDPVRWLPVSRDYPGAEVLNWKDLSPRLGLAYDLFGNGRTALKFSMSRYVLQEGKNNTNNIHPVIAATNNVSRTWTDSNRDFVVQGDPLNPALNGELALTKLQLRQAADDAPASIRTGLPVSTSYNWEMLVSVQHELIPRMGIEISYNRRAHGNFIVNDNTLVSLSDYDLLHHVTRRHCFPDGGGQQICGLFDLKFQGRTGRYIAHLRGRPRRSNRDVERARRHDADPIPGRGNGPGRLEPRAPDDRQLRHCRQAG